ncbi:phage major capsid protein [Streptomyces sp. ST2-7A]|uniref:phage major capsid protein n=1 Tax=Streptomyces sp. ST2-7A TaxID=2907214 RepID=UPI001F39297C|nr:phage major capsid protein [Streptomyces sp. ST2-7A]MCE7081156.1 phage major capsid protein [Streptomyces sp. ST2-7A]
MTFENWIPEEWGSNPITRVEQRSAVEALARPEMMSAPTKHVPREEGVGVQNTAKGTAYVRDTSTNGEVLLTRRKITGAIQIAEEDLTDAAPNVIETKKVNWATSAAKYLDNAALGTSGAMNGTTVPYESLYYLLGQSNAETAYTAGDNIVLGDATYEALSDVAGRYEDSDYFDAANTHVIASPVFKRLFRDVRDDENRPVFVQGRDSTPDTLWGYPVFWSTGCRVSAAATVNPVGNPLLYVGNTDYLISGRGFGRGITEQQGSIESQIIPPEISDTDEALLKMRLFRAFALGHEHAWACLEYDPAQS